MGYCRQAFEAQLEMEDLVWENGEIVFKKGCLRKEGELNVTFEKATLVPFLDWKLRIFGGTLDFKELKIVHCKKQIRPVPAPPPPSFKLLTLQLNTTVIGGELLLYDYLAHNPLLQKVNFDLNHQVHGKQTYGRIAFECSPNTPPFIAHFHGLDEERLELNVHLERHSCPILSHLVTYFFHRYVPNIALQWNILEGIIDGDLEMVLIKGVPLIIKGKVDLNGVQAENLSLEIKAQFDHLGGVLDSDFSHIGSINSLFELTGGTLCLCPNNWNLENLNSRICIQAGKMESALVKGNLMGMEGEIKLDWQMRDAVMQMSFSGFCGQLCSQLPISVRKGFDLAFPNDFFMLNACLKRLETRLELEGILAIHNQDSTIYPLNFGCLLGQIPHSFCDASFLDHLIPFAVKHSIIDDAKAPGLIDREVVNIKNIDHFTIDQSRELSLSSIMECFTANGIKRQFCLSQKISGWFEGEGFPLEKFVSPFLFQNIRMNASGLTDFKGTFDGRYVTIFYEGKDFCLESPYFRFHVDRVKKNVASGVPASHHWDLRTRKHFGFLPITEGEYFQKNHRFLLEDASALIYFENNTVHIQEITTQGEGIDFQGDAHLVIRSPEDVELIIKVQQLQGAIRDAGKFLSHFKPSFLWELPMEGEVVGEGQALYFHYHFTPLARLLEGRVQGRVNCSASYLSKHPLEAVMHYDCLTQELICNVTEQENPFLNLQAITSESAEGKKIVVIGNGLAPYETIHFEVLQNKGDLPALSRIHFECGPCSGGGDVHFSDHEITLNQMTCSLGQKSGLCFSGIYDKKEKTVKGELHDFKWDLISFLEKNPIPGVSQGVLSGSGPLVWNMKMGLCTVEGLKVKIATIYEPPESNGEAHLIGKEETETYTLGRCHYDTALRKVHVEGFDFSLSREKVDWVAHMGEVLFPNGVDLSLVDFVRGLKHNEPLKGHLSFEASPNNVWVCLNLKDGKYDLGGKELHLQNFCLTYDPSALNISTQCLYRDTPYWMHLITDSTAMDRGALSFSQQPLTSDAIDQEKITVDWERREGQGWGINAIEGKFCGIEIALLNVGKRDVSDKIFLDGHIGCNLKQVAHLLAPALKEKIERLSVVGHYTLDGEFNLDKSSLLSLGFIGTLLGVDCEARGVGWSAFSSNLEYRPGHLRLSDCAIKDKAGELSIHELILSQKQEEWHVALDALNVSDVYVSRLKSPWTQWGPRDKPFFRSLYIRSFMLEQFQGQLKDIHTLIGTGRLEFSHIPKRTFLSNLLFLPTEITARIGLDLTALVPARGIISYTIQNGKVHFQEFKEMYSEGKYSRFYLAEGFPAYIDFQGNLNMKLKMKQYNLLMKLAEFFTITVRGNWLHPSYTFTNHTDDI